MTARVRRSSARATRSFDSIPATYAAGKRSASGEPRPLAIPHVPDADDSLDLPRPIPRELGKPHSCLPGVVAIQWPNVPLTVAAPGVLSNDSDPEGDALMTGPSHGSSRWTRKGRSPARRTRTNVFTAHAV
jgi:hypothetical protein